MQTIAISGKGGTGKSTLAALITGWLCKNKTNSLLVVDADPNVNLNELLGVDLKATIGAIREEMKASVHNLPGGMTKQQFLEYKIQSSIVETPNFDLLAMGRPEGPGCYCYANNLLRDILSMLNRNYEYSVIDNEAGMEHLSRRTVQDIDHLLVISDSSLRGIRAATKIATLVKELESRVKNKHLILNRVGGALTQEAQKVVAGGELPLLSSIPEDKTLLELDQQGKPVWDLPEESPASKAVNQFMKNLLR